MGCSSYIVPNRPFEPARNAGLRLMQIQARIVGIVTYREGDGMAMEIPQGPVAVEESFDGYTLSWQDGDTVGAATLPKADYERFVKTKAIVVG